MIPKLILNKDTRIVPHTPEKVKSKELRELADEILHDLDALKRKVEKLRQAL